MPSGAELFVDTALRLGIRDVFTLVGDHLNEVLTAAARRGMRIFDMRHESGVTHAADAWARIHRKPALSLVTGGPGHTNSLTGIATAFQNGTPLIAVSGAASTAMAGRQVFQVIDQPGMAAPVTKWSAQPAGAAQIPYYLTRAFREAVAGRMGPVHLSIPVNYFEAQADNPVPAPPPPPMTEARPSRADVAKALDLLRGAERPVVIAGSGVWWSGAGKELKQFIEMTSLPCYTVTMARGVVPDSHRLVFGYADGALNKAVHKVFPAADAVLVLGKRIDYRLALGGPRLFSPAAKFIQVDIHEPEIGSSRAVEVGIRADIRATLIEMIEVSGEVAWEPRLSWLKTLRAARKEWQEELAAIAADRSLPIHPAAFFTELKKALPPDVLYAWDGGDVVHWGRAILPANLPGGWLRLGPLGTIGSALPISAALKLAHPKRPVVMITGDGSLGFYLAELDTLVRHRLPVVVIVGNDAGWGLERELQREFHGGTVACELRATRYDQIMRGFGGEGLHIERLDQVLPAVRQAFRSARPTVMNVMVRGARSPFTQWQVQGKKAAAQRRGN